MKLVRGEPYGEVKRCGVAHPGSLTFDQFFELSTRAHAVDDGTPPDEVAVLPVCIKDYDDNWHEFFILSDDAFKRLGKFIYYFEARSWNLAESISDKINVRIPDRILQETDKLAQDRGMTRDGIVEQALAREIVYSQLRADDRVEYHRLLEQEREMEMAHDIATERRREFEERNGHE